MQPQTFTRIVLLASLALPLAAQQGSSGTEGSSGSASSGSVGTSGSSGSGSPGTSGTSGSASGSSGSGSSMSGSSCSSSASPGTSGSSGSGSPGTSGTSASSSSSCSGSPGTSGTSGSGSPGTSGTSGSSSSSGTGSPGTSGTSGSGSPGTSGSSGSSSGSTGTSSSSRSSSSSSAPGICCPNHPEVRNLGPGCAPSSLIVPAITEFGTPQLEAELGVNIACPSCPNSFSFLGYGFSATFNPVFMQPLPIDLGQFGFSGCFLRASTEFVVMTMLDANGDGVHTFSVPRLLKWCEREISFQSYALSPQSDLLVSNGLLQTVGS